MKFYKTPTDEVIAIEQGQEFLVKSDWVLMNDAEVELFKNPSKTQGQIDAEIKQAKEDALNSITVTTASGKVFDGRDKDRARMNEAITASTILGLAEAQWKLHDNTVATITLDELKEALALSIQAAGTIIVGS